MSEAPKCQHVRSNGTQCGSPALKDNSFCYYHQRCRPVTFTYGRYVSDYGRREITLPAFEDAHSIQLTLHRVTELVLRHQIEDKDARMVLFALQLATFNLKHIERDQPKPEDVVTDPPLEAASETEPTDNVDGDADEDDDNGPPPGTIHACIDTAPVRRVARFPRSASGRRNTTRLSSTFLPFDKSPASATQLNPASDACFGPASNPIELPPFRVTSTPSPPRGPR